MTWVNAPWTSNYLKHLAMLIEISVTYPDSITLVFTDKPVFDNTNYSTGGASVGQASAVFVAAFNVGGAGAEHTVVLQNIRPFDGNANPNTATDLAALLTYYTLHGASVKIRQYAEDDSGAANRVLLNAGRVQGVTDVTAASVALVLTEAGEIDNSVLPERTVEELYSGVVDSEEIPKDSKGMALPMRLGPRFYLPDSVSPGMSTTQSYDLVKSGCQHSRCSLIPARFARKQRHAATQHVDWWVYQERPANMGGYDQTAHSPAGYVYEPALDSFSEMQDVIEWSEESGTWYYAKIAPDNVLSGYLVPKEVEENSSSGVTDPGKAIDGRLDTWMRMEGVAKRACFTIPQVGNPGNIINDPTGIQVAIYTIGGMPPGETLAADGLFRASIMHGGGVAQGYQYQHVINTPGIVLCDYTGWRFFTITGSNGWYGTKWQTWDFTSSGTDAQGDPNRNIYGGSQDSGGNACVLGIELNATGTNRVYVIAAAVRCLYKRGSKNFTEYRRDDRDRQVWARGPYPRFEPV